MSAGTGEDGAELVVFSPLPPSPSGIAAYAEELLPALARHLRPVVVVARDADIVPPPAGVAEVLSERRYRARPALHALPHLFQLGNSLDHQHVYRAALRIPGIVVLHDLVLHHLVEALTLGRGSWAAYEAAVAYSHGAAGRRLARLRRLGLFSPAQRFLMPLHRQVLDRARGVIVHSRFAAARLQAPADLPVRVVPHHASPRATAHDGRRGRGSACRRTCRCCWCSAMSRRPSSRTWCCRRWRCCGRGTAGRPRRRGW